MVVVVFGIGKVVTYSRMTSSTFLVTSAIAAFSAMVECGFVGNRGDGKEEKLGSQKALFINKKTWTSVA